MDVLAAHQSRPAPLEGVARLLGLPGKLGMSGGQVATLWRAGQYKQVRNYCEFDVLNTYLIFLRFEIIQGHVDPQQYNDHCARMRTLLRESNHEHWHQFLAAWDEAQQ